MCDCTKNINLKVLAAKPQIEQLFNRYGIISAVTVDNVNIALSEEGEDFEEELLAILRNVQLANNTGETTTKAENALSWIDTVGGIGTGIAGAFASSKTPVNNYYTTPTTGASSNTTTIVIIAVVGAALLAAVVWFASKK